MLSASSRQSCVAGKRILFPRHASPRHTSTLQGTIKRARNLRSDATIRPLSTTTHPPSGNNTENVPATTATATATATAATAAATARATPTSGNDPAGDNLNWNTFFRLRKVRRRYNLAASMVTSVGTTVSGIAVLSRQDIDAIGGQLFGMDPFVVLGLATVGCGAMGWLAGPFLGNAVFNLVNQRVKDQMALKEKGFYARIKRFRVDPSSQSLSNPVPDYYGEKIGSVAGYRQWLKDQRAYNKKRQSFV
ncbi:MAG: TIM23 complex component [Peltula sp. TS41687]|nr:MAG: TIM23 complex component [Peltula sp. TS41687]